MTEEQDNRRGKPVSGNKSGMFGAAFIGTVGEALPGLAALPKELEQYPVGAAILAFMVVCGLCSWVLVTWLKNRRK